MITFFVSRLSFLALQASPTETDRARTSAFSRAVAVPAVCVGVRRDALSEKHCHQPDRPDESSTHRIYNDPLEDTRRYMLPALAGTFLIFCIIFGSA